MDNSNYQTNPNQNPNPTPSSNASSNVTANATPNSVQIPNNNGVNLTKKQRKKLKRHYWWRYLLCFLGGVLFIPVVAGAAGFTLTTQVKTADVIKMTGNDPDKVLTPQYQTSTIWTLIEDLINGKIKIDSLEGISEITPLIDSFEDDLIDGLNASEAVKQDLRLILEEVNALGFSEYGTELYALVMGGLKLESFIDTQSLGDDPLVQKVIDALFYKTEGNEKLPITLEDVLSSGLDVAGSLENLQLKDFITGDFSGSVFEIFVDRLLYKEVGGEKVPVTISDIMDDPNFFTNAFSNEFINSIKISEIVEINENTNAILKALKDKTIGDLSSSELLNEIYLRDVLEVDTSDLSKYNNILLSLCFKKDSSGNFLTDDNNCRPISDLTKSGGIDDIINEIKLGDVISTDNKIFDAFKSLSIGDLKDENLVKQKINEIKISDLIGDAPTNSVLESIKDSTIGELQGEDYFDSKTLEELLGLQDSTNKLLNKIKHKTLKQLSDGEILDGLTIGDVLDDDNIQASPILKAIADKEISSLNQDSFNNIRIWEVLGITSSTSKILKVLENSTVGSLTNDIDNMVLGDFFNDEDLANSALLRRLKDEKLNELSADTFNSLLIEEVIDINDDSPKFLKVLKEKGATISNASSIIDSLTIGDAVDCENSPILGIIKDCRITDSASIENAINEAKISTFLDESSCFKYVNGDGLYSNELLPGYNKNPDYNPIIGAISGLSIGSLSSEINNIKIKDMFDEPDTSTMFGKILNKIDDDATFGNLEETFSVTIDNMTLGELLGDTSSSPILSSLSGYKINELSNAIKELKITTVFHDEIYGSGDSLTGIWKYLLKDPSGVKSPEDYTINEMASLANNVMANIQNTKIYDLINDGIFTAPDGIVDKKILYGGRLVEVGELTLTQFFTAVNDLIG